MARIEKLSISLPSALLKELERFRKESGESRSALVRRAIEQLLAGRARDARVERYLEGYLRHPETTQEISAAEARAAESLGREPWE